MDEKPKFTELEIEELCDMYLNFGYSKAVYEIMRYLNTMGVSDTHKIMVDLRKKFQNEIIPFENKKFGKKWKDSTLNKKLSDRIDYDMRPDVIRDKKINSLLE
jgi:hypothetical protein